MPATTPLQTPPLPYRLLLVVNFEVSSRSPPRRRPIPMLTLMVDRRNNIISESTTTNRRCSRLPLNFRRRRLEEVEVEVKVRTLRFQLWTPLQILPTPSPDSTSSFTVISTRVWRRSCASVSEDDKDNDNDDYDDVPELEDFAIFVQLILCCYFHQFWSILIRLIRCAILFLNHFLFFILSFSLLFFSFLFHSYLYFKTPPFSLYFSITTNSFFPINKNSDSFHHNSHTHTALFLYFSLVWIFVCLFNSFFFLIKTHFSN